MPELMSRLAGFLGRRRRWVAAFWILAVVLALPFASRQTEHLSGGGFDVPGSQSDSVSQSIQRDFSSRAAGIAVLLRAEASAPAAERAAAVGRLRRRVAALGSVQLSAPAARVATLSAVVPASRLSRIARVEVGGETARTNDLRVQISGSIWKILAFILGLSFVVLMVMLRSVPLALKAVLMNLLSIGAAFGVLVAVFQWGWLNGILGFESLGALDSINVPLILAVIFGLSMDYEVFLLSRIRERYMAHGDNRRAVAEGLSSSARTISSAALIMTSVFAVFVLTGVLSIKELGLGCAVAIALDATLVRLILVPAAMVLLGEWNWWMPSWLGRLLPDLHPEGVAAPNLPAVKA